MINYNKNLTSSKINYYFILIVILIITVPNFNTPSMADTNAIVTLLSVDKEGDQVLAVANVVKPSKESGMCCEAFMAKNSTLGEAIEDISFMIGKNLAFSQCEVMAFGDGISRVGIMSDLDFITRVKKVSRNTLLFNVGGDIKEFNKSVIDLSKNQQLKIENVLGYTDKFTIQKDHSIETFYQKYYSKLGYAILPRLTLSKEEVNDSIEVSVSSQESTSGSSGSTQLQDRNYLTNDGRFTIYKKGKTELMVDNEMAYNLSLLSPNGFRGTIRADHVTDDLYDDASLLFSVTNADCKIKANYDKDKPKITINISLMAFIEQVVENKPTEKFLIRNEQFISNEAQKRLKETAKEKALEALGFCKDNDLDLLDVYSYFDKFHHRKTKSIVNNSSIEEFLQDVEYEVNVDVKSTF